MGAGCYYTLPDSRDMLAYWVSLELDQTEEDRDEFDSEFYHEIMMEDLTSLLLELPLCKEYNGVLYYGDNFTIELPSTYYGDGILINLVMRLPDYDEKYNFVLSNLERVYKRIIKHVNKSLPLRRAAGAWCSASYAIGEIK